MHVYHYASYEPTALKRLMGRHATREDEVDRLLRGGILVDLFRAVRQGLRASVESYSIKRIEPLYDFVRDDSTCATPAPASSPSRSGSSSATATGQPPTSSTRSRPTTATTCVARWRCATGSRGFAVSSRDAAGRPSRGRREVSREAPVSTAAADARVQEVGDALTAGVPDDAAARSDEQQARWLLAQLLSWHRRESKVAYWEFFHRLGLDATELTVDKAALGPLEVVGPVGEPWRPTPRSQLRADVALPVRAAGLRHRIAVGALRPGAPSAPARRSRGRRGS